MKLFIALALTIVILPVLGFLLYFYFAVTLIVAACITLAVIIGSILWAFGKYELSEIIDPIREKYRMNTIWSKGYGGHQDIEDAARKNGQDARVTKNLLNTGNEAFRRMGFIESLPEWIIKQAIPFLAVSAPKWIIAIIIGVLIIRFHEDIIPHKKADTVQLSPNEVTLRLKVSGDIQKGEYMRDSTIDVSDYCMRAHSNSHVIVLSDDGCN